MCSKMTAPQNNDESVPSSTSSSPNKDGVPYEIGSVSVTDAGPDSPVAYEYSDLKRYTTHLPTVVFSTVYWPFYVCFVFPIQNILRGLIWSLRRERYSPIARGRMLVQDTVAILKKFKFFTKRDRTVVYLRASRIFTPAQITPFLPGTAPIAEDPESEQRPTPDNWDTMRQSVYERDNYHCVNCQAAGGPYGNTELHADHIIPRSQGGDDTQKNLRTLCRSCHEARHARVF